MLGIHSPEYLCPEGFLFRWIPSFFLCIFIDLSLFGFYILSYFVVVVYNG